MKLVLGTAQFGLNYGVSNTSGKTLECQVSEILDLALKSGIDTLDTARSYGDSEKVIGKLTNNDKWIIKFLKGKRKGFFIEAGAFDGITNSCTYTLEKYYGWTGILIEPSIIFNQLNKNRSKSKCVNALLGKENLKETFMFFPKAPMSSCTESNFTRHKIRVIESHNGKHKFDVVKKKLRQKHY